MNAKCPVCDYVLENVRIEVRVGDRIAVVCCEECAEKLRQEQKSRTAR